MNLPTPEIGNWQLEIGNPRSPCLGIATRELQCYVRVALRLLLLLPVFLGVFGSFFLLGHELAVIGGGGGQGVLQVA